MKVTMEAGGKPVLVPTSWQKIFQTSKRICDTTRDPLLEWQITQEADDGTKTTVEFIWYKNSSEIRNLYLMFLHARWYLHFDDGRMVETSPTQEWRAFLVHGCGFHIAAANDEMKKLKKLAEPGRFE